MKQLLRSLLIPTGLALVLLLARGLLFYQHLHQPLNIEKNYILDVRPGSNFRFLLRQLDSAGVIAASNDLIFYARVQNLAQQIKAGEYELPAGTTALGLLQVLVKGQVIYHQVTLLEGWTLREALRALQAHPAIVSVLDSNDPAAIQQAFQATVYPEGQFFPDTYNFTRGTTDLEILQRAAVHMRQILDEQWQTRAAGLPYASPEEALVLASIIEKETAVASERELIAGVFIRRLQHQMRLQTDPTVIYGLGDSFTGNLTRENLRQDTPWNTYTRDGLPPTPIALPGKASIAASMHPDDADTLYFVARGDGSHYFSSTLDEHNKAVRQYQLGSPLN